MNHKLLTKFVFSGMQKNKKTLIPYLLAGTMTVMIYYILQSLAHCPYIYKDGMEAFYGAQIISILLEISGQIVAVFAAVFLFYTNQFMIRARKKEMGLYCKLCLNGMPVPLLRNCYSIFNGTKYR